MSNRALACQAGSQHAPLMRYVVITPVRNEAAYLPATIASMTSQSWKPMQWVLVDDGSSDATAQIADEAARRHGWIRSVHRRDRGARVAGNGVIESFYAGYEILDRRDWEFIVKLDGDLSFEPDYFRRCLHEFSTDPRLGIASGVCCRQDGAERVPEFSNEPAFHVRGPCKIYRRECYFDIGGLLQAPGWDTVDQVKANMLGWATRTLPGLTLVHLRATGGAYGSWANWKKNGLANYVAGYAPLFMLCKCAKRLLGRPGRKGIREAAGLAWGFASGYLRRIPQVQDPALIAYLRQQQRRALLLRSSLWR